jgi:hypothetical protein
MDDTTITASIETDVIAALALDDPKFRSGPAEWEALRRAIADDDEVADFAYVGTTEGVHVYRHTPTGRFLNLDNRGRPYRYDVLTDGFRPTSKRRALRHIFGNGAVTAPASARDHPG